jgi:hypothetical protein
MFTRRRAAADTTLAAGTALAQAPVEIAFARDGKSAAP